jgi:hypothetical protein
MGFLKFIEYGVSTGSLNQLLLQRNLILKVILKFELCVSLEAQGIFGI